MNKDFFSAEKLKIGQLLLSLSMLLTFEGCGGKERDFQPISGGFGVSTKWVGIDSGPGAAFYFKAEHSAPTLIWPYLGPAAGPILITNDMAFFRASAPNIEGELVYPVFIVVQAPGPALEITDDLLKFWAELQKLDFQNLKGHYTPVDEKSVENGIWVSYATGEQYPEAKFVISWEQLSDIIQDVKRTGRRLTLKESHVVYLKKDHNPTLDVK